jgi:hypothetical protein
MKVIVCSLDGVKWCVVGESTLVDPRYLREYKRTKRKIKLTRHDYWATTWVQLAACMYFAGVAMHVLFVVVL